MRHNTSVLGQFIKISILMTIAVFVMLLFATIAEASTFTVTTNSDSTAIDANCTFREALFNADNDNLAFPECGPSAGSGTDNIEFAVGTGAIDITLTSDLYITSSVNIDGTTQPGGASCGTNDTLSDRTLLVSVNGNSQTYDIIFNGASNVSITGMNFYGMDESGITISNGGTFDITCNHFGTNLAGTAVASSLNTDHGIAVTEALGSVATIVIGGNTPAERNILSGNTNSGIQISGGDNIVIAGNYIGTDKAGTTTIPNGSGVIVLSSTPVSSIAIGGDRDSGWGNVIAGNDGSGAQVYRFAAAVSNVKVQGNIIGFAPDGTTHLPNGVVSDATGLVIYGSVDGYTVGGSSSGLSNIVSGSGVGAFGAAGVGGAPPSDGIISGNYFCVDGTGNTARLPASTANNCIVLNTSDTLFGGNTAAQRNIVGAGNSSVAMAVLGTPYSSSAPSNLRIQGNYFNTGANGSQLSSSTGLLMALGTNYKDTLVGGINTGEANIFRGGGIRLLSLSTAGLITDNISILGNAIYNLSSSFPIAIDLTDDIDTDFEADVGVGVNTNDAGDTDTNVANEFMNSPDITNLQDLGNNTLRANFTLDVPVGTYRIEFFDSSSVQYRQAETFLDAVTVTSSVVGEEYYTADIDTSNVASVTKVRASATETATTSWGYGSTSELGKTVVLIADAVNESGGESGGCADCAENEDDEEEVLAECSLAAEPAVLASGEASVLSWTSNITTGDVVSGRIKKQNSGNVLYTLVQADNSGSLVVFPSETTTYILENIQGVDQDTPTDCAVQIFVGTDPETPDNDVPVVTTDPENPTTPTNPETPTEPSGPTDSETTSETTNDISPSDNNGAHTGTNRSPNEGARRLAQIIAAIAIAATLPTLLPRLLNLLLGFLGFRKKQRSWGTVYNAVTKQPLDPAYVTLMNEAGEEVASAITDPDGRYGFVVDPGTYTIEAAKTNFVFPSQTLAGKSKDELYNNLYFGEKVTVKEHGEVITENIPMDPVGEDWNEQAKASMGSNVFSFFSKHDRVIIQIINFLFVVGFALSIFLIITAPNTWNIVIFFLYVFLLLVMLLGVRPTRSGKILHSGESVPFAIVRIYNASLNKEIAHKVTNQYGQYYALVPKGEYYITVEAKNQSGNYSHIYTSETMRARNGVLNADFRV